MSVDVLVFLLAGEGVNSHVSSLPAYIAYTWNTNGLTTGSGWSLDGGESILPPRART